MPRLSNSTLPYLPATVIRPLYDRKLLQSGILHFGPGNFHRAHQAVYTEDVLNTEDLRWGITGISLRRADIRDALAPQDGLYTVGVRSAAGTEWRVIGAIRNIIFAPDNPRATLQAIASPATRVISLTVTEKAYCLDAKSGTLDETHPDILHDLANPEQPRSVLGYLVAGLAKRQRQNISFPTLVSCDNLTSNGKKLRAALIRFAECQKSELAKNLADHLLCPSTMVDRIVPHTTDHDRDAAADVLGVQDAWPVMTEPFTQWAIEDQFALERPEWDRFGAEFVTDVAPYERMKLSLLNASHTALAILGVISGYDTVASAMNDKALGPFISRLMRDDIALVLALPAEMNVSAYIDALLSRFRNPALHHKLLQIASDSSQKIPQRFMPTILERLKRGLPLGGFAYAIAGFVVLLEGKTQTGKILEWTDPKRDMLQSLIQRANHSDQVRALLSQSDIFGQILEFPNVANEVQAAFLHLKKDGVQRALSSQT